MTSLRKIFLLAIYFFSAMAPISCDYARMKEQESLRPYKKAMPEMPAGIIPREGGIEMLKRVKPETLRNPFPFASEQVKHGKESYAYFCVMCHGPKADGHGTVGQSFYPLPSDLSSPYVQDQADGLLFYKISLGFKRHPPLANTISEEDRWAIIHYLRSLGKNKSS
jgi:mono/diheme cytochrome c family protein